VAPSVGLPETGEGAGRTAAGRIEGAGDLDDETCHRGHAVVLVVVVVVLVPVASPAVFLIVPVFVVSVTAVVITFVIMAFFIVVIVRKRRGALPGHRRTGADKRGEEAE